jgi:hypothetical protein
MVEEYIWHEDAFSESPQALAAAYRDVVERKFPEVFQPEAKFFVDPEGYPDPFHPFIFRACDGTTIEEARQSFTTRPFAGTSSPDRALAAGYQPVCDGKRENGGSLERFLLAYWALHKDLIWAYGVTEWMMLGLRMGAALQEMDPVCIDGWKRADAKESGS